MTRSAGVPRSPTLADRLTLPRRGRISGHGFVERVTILPRSAIPQFSAMVALHEPRDARVRLLWTGQRRIPGIDPGINLAFEGMLTIVDGVPTIHNPRYEIVGRVEESE